MTQAAPRRNSCQIVFMGFVLLIGLLAILLTGSRPSPSPQNSATGSDTATPGFPCQPGISAGSSVGIVYSAVRMRRSPGYVGKNDTTDSIHYMRNGDRVTVQDGPREVDGLCWWLVRHGGFEGWVADRSSDGQPLLSP